MDLTLTGLFADLLTDLMEKAKEDKSPDLSTYSLVVALWYGVEEALEGEDWEYEYQYEEMDDEED